MKAADPNEGHDPLCPVEPCLCALIHLARVDERQRPRVIRPDILAAIEAETIRAREKHGVGSIHLPFLDDDARLGVLRAEVDEVWRAVAKGLPIDHPHGLRAELTQVAASAIGWLACLPLPTVPPAAQLDGQTDILEELR